MLGVSVSVHFPDGLIVLVLIFLFLVQREGLLTLVGGLFILLFFVVAVRQVDEVGEGFIPVEESQVVLAEWRGGYMREARKDSSSRRPSTCCSVIWAWVCYLSAPKSFSRHGGRSRGLGSLRRKWRTSKGVLAVRGCGASEARRSISVREGTVTPFFRFFLRSFSILTNLRKNFCAWERTCEVVRDSTLL